MSTSVFEPTRKMVEAMFQTSWAARTPVKYDNALFAQPTNAAFVSVSVRWGESQQASIGPAGARMERHSAAIMVQVFVPENSGSKDLSDHCDVVAAIFRMQTIRDNTAGIEVEFRSPRRSFGGTEKELRFDVVAIELQVDSFF